MPTPRRQEQQQPVSCVYIITADYCGGHLLQQWMTAAVGDHHSK